MRHVFSNSHDVARDWSNYKGEQSFARNPRGSVFYESDTIYSYGHHFPIARHVWNDESEHAILFTIKGYSNTTAHHKSIVLRSCGSPVFFVSDVHNTNPALELLRKVEEIKETVQQWMRARTHEELRIGQLRQQCLEAANFARFYNLQWEMPRDGIFAQLAIED